MYVHIKSDENPSVTKPTSIPLYVKISHQLRRKIDSGEYPVGSLLPTELTLAQSHSVSRQTIRQAIRHLRDQKLVSARKGVGTRVETHDPDQAFYHSLQSLEQIFQFASEAILRITSEGIVSVHGRLASELGCKQGKKWLRLEGYRQVKNDKRPLSWTEVYIDARFAKFVQGRSRHEKALFSVIESETGEAVTEVEQRIEAVLPDRDVADVIDAAGMPAIRITRRYFGARGQLIERSVNVHPADRFAYSMRFSRDIGNSQDDRQ